MGFTRQEYWSGLLLPSPRNLPNPGTESQSPALAGGFLTTKSPYSTKAGIQMLASSEQARKRKKERREEMVELKDCQQQETEGKVRFHSCLTQTEHMFASFQVFQLKVHV